MADEPNDKDKNGGDAPAEVKLTQEKLDELLDKAYARGAKNSKDAKEVASMKKELDELRGMKDWLEAEAAKQKDAPKDGSDPNAEAAYQAKLQEIKDEYDKRVEKLESDYTSKENDLRGSVDELRLAGLRAEVVSGIAGQAANADDVFTLMNAKGIFKLDDESGKYVVVNPETGKVRLDVDADGEPLAPGKAAVEFLDDNPMYKRASGRTGSGQGAGDDAGGEGPPSDLDTSKMRPSDIYAKRHEILADLRRRGA